MASTSAKRLFGVWIVIAGGAALLACLLWWAWRPAPEGGGVAPVDREARESGASADTYRDEVARLMKAGRLEEAETVIRTWTAAIPGDERAVLARAELAARHGRPAEAMALYTSVVESSPDPARVWLRIADLEESMGQPETAISSCRKAVAARPDENDARLRLGDLLRIVGRLDEAAETLEPLVEETPSMLPARHALAAVRNGQGRFEEVIALIEPLLGDASLPANAREHYAVALDELGRRSEAAEVWTDLLEADPYLVEGYYRLGRLARRLKRPRFSRAMLRRYEELTTYREKLESARKLELSGRRVAASIERAEAYAGSDQVRLAVEHLQQALRAPGLDVDTALASILSFLRLDLFYEAREAVRILRSTPALPGHLADAMIGLTSERAGDVEAATAAYERALAARPDYRTVLLALGRIRLDDGQVSAADALIRRAHKAQVDGESSLLAGRVALESGDRDTARARLQEAIELSTRRRWRTEARVYLGRIRLTISDAQGARRILEEVVAESPTRTDAWSTLADACRSLGESERAVEAARKAAELESIEDELSSVRRTLAGSAGAARSSLYVRLADLAARSGNHARQVRYLRTALYVDPENAEAVRQLAGACTEPSEVFLRLHALKRLVNLRPKDVAARRLRAEARAAVRDSGSGDGP